MDQPDQLRELFRMQKSLNERIGVHTDGMTDEQIIAYMRERYGDFVLYDPPLDGAAIIIWLVPAGLVLLAISLLGLALSRIRTPKKGVVSEEQRTEMRELLKDD